MAEEQNFGEADKPLRAYSRPLSGMRRAIAHKMKESYFSNPTVTLTTEIDMTEAQMFREKWNREHEKEGLRLSFLDMIICTVSHSLHNHPSFNATLKDEKIYFIDNVNIGFAVDMNGRGLVVPVICDADKKSLGEIATERKRLANKSLAGKADMSDITGGTFTVTNLGAYGIDAFTPIINAPECAILGIGRITEKPVAVCGEIKIRSCMTLSLTHDHRLNDGGPAAKFLKEISNRLENPSWMD